MVCRRVLFLVLLLSFSSTVQSQLTKHIYTLSPQPIDVVIPSTHKDLPTLDLCIQGIRIYGENIGRIIVVSAER
jgi:hypothetical protein